MGDACCGVTMIGLTYATLGCVELGFGVHFLGDPDCATSVLGGVTPPVWLVVSGSVALLIAFAFITAVCCCADASDCALRLLRAFGLLRLLFSLVWLITGGALLNRVGSNCSPSSLLGAFIAFVVIETVVIIADAYGRIVPALRQPQYGQFNSIH